MFVGGPGSGFGIEVNQVNVSGEGGRATLGNTAASNFKIAQFVLQQKRESKKKEFSLDFNIAQFVIQ